MFDTRYQLGRKFCASLVLACGLAILSLPAFAGTAHLSGSATSGPVTTFVPTITGGLVTNFTGYTYNSGPWNYALQTFTVSQTGVYTASLTTTPHLNTTFFLNGTFAPGASPSTPISNFIAELLASNIGGTNYNSSFTNLNLVAGQQYSILIAFDVQGLPNSDTFTLDMSGPGCIAIGSNTCQSAGSIPTLSEWGLVALICMLGVLGMYQFRRNKKIAA